MSLFSILADRGARASMVRDDSLQMQTVEQERMAEFYFRILSWLSDVIPRAAEPAKATSQAAPQRQTVKSPRRPDRQGRIDLCAFHYVQNLVAGKSRARTSINSSALRPYLPSKRQMDAASACSTNESARDT